MESNMNNGIALSSEWMPSKTEIARITDSLCEKVTQGEVDPLSAVVIIDALRKAIEEAEKIVKPYAIAECDKYAKGDKILSKNCEISKREAGVKYDYSSCGDPVWNELKEQSDAIQVKIKERESILKQLKEKLVSVDVRTGEVIELYPPLKKSTTTIVITYPEK